MNRITWAVAALLAVVFFLSIGHTEQVAKPEPAPEGRIRITYWEKWTNFEEQAMREVVNKFNESQDKYFVDMLSVSGITNKVLLSTSGGIPPDVAGLFGAQMAQYGALGLARPLDDLIERDGIRAEDYIPAYWEMGRYEDRHIAFPSTPATTALHYNAADWRAGGFDPDNPPKTLEEFDKIAFALNKKTADGKLQKAGFLPNEPGWWNFGFGALFGAKYWDGGDKLLLNSPEMIEAYEWVQKYHREIGPGAVSNFKGGLGTFDSPQNGFMSGTVSSVLQGVWMANFIQMHNPDLDWRAAPFPHPASKPEMEGFTFVDMDILIIPRGAKNVEGAWEFIKYVQSQEGMELLCTGQAKHTPLVKVSDEFWANHKNPQIKLFHAQAFNEAAFAPVKLSMWPEIQGEMNAVYEAISGPELVNVTERLNRAQERLQPLLEKELRIRRAREAMAKENGA